MAVIFVVVLDAQVIIAYGFGIMIKMSKCACCGKEYKLSRKDKVLRKMVTLQSKMFPGLKEACEDSKDFCNDCWKKAVNPVAKAIKL